MERLFIYLNNEVLKARRAEPYETLSNPLKWREIEFEYTTSPMMMITWPILLPELPPKAARSLLELVGARYPFSPYHGELKSLCPELIFKSEEEEWVFFGGSFDPWHKGHQACLNLLPEDKLCFILPDRNPLKDFREIEPVSNVIELVKHIKFGKHHYMAPTFLFDNQKNPTVTWMESFHQRCPEKKPSLLIGFDTLRNFMKWQRPQDLLNLLDTLYVASRLEDDKEREAAAAPLKQIAPQIKIEFLGRHEFEGLSSTELRKNK